MRARNRALIGALLGLALLAGVGEALCADPTPAAAPAGVEAAPAPEVTPVEPAVAGGTQAFVLGDAAGTLAPLLDINIGPVSTKKGTAELTKLYQERGVRLIRTHDYKGAFDLASADTTATDEMVGHIGAGGFGIYLRLGNSFGAGASTASVSDLTASMLGMVDHVQAKAGKDHPVEYVEVWNEPDNKEFWTQGDDAYIALYIEAAGRLRAAHPGLKIGGPALTPAGALIPRGRAFVEHFLAAVKSAGAPLDFITWHMYSNDPQAFADAARFYREAAEKAGFGDLPQHVTEWNTAYKAGRDGAGGGPGPRGKGDAKAEGGGPRGDGPREGGPRGGGPREGGPREGGRRGDDGAGGEDPRADKRDTAVRIGAKGSALATAAWIAMQQSGVDRAFFYRGPDPAPYPSAFFGMFYNDGRPKPAGFAALLWKRLVDHPTRFSLTAPGTGPIWALAGRSASGATNVLVANATDQPQTWTLPCPAQAALPVHTTRLRAPAEALEEATQPDCGGTLEAWEVRSLSWTGGG